MQNNLKEIPNQKPPHWFSPITGIYTSKHPPIPLPSDPFLDVVSFIFSHNHNGVSALIDSSSGFSISHSDLFPLVKSMAAVLHSVGIKQGDVVLLLLPNSIYFPVLFLGVLYLGAIVSTMNPLSSVSEIRKQIADCNACMVFSVAGNSEKLQSLRIPVICVPENSDCFKGRKEFKFYNLICGHSDLGFRPVIRQEDTAAILYSSGTTGSSKGVVLTHRNLMSAVVHFVRFEASQYEYPGSDNVYLAVLPMFHVYGLSLFVLGLLSLGSTIVVMRRSDVNDAVNVIEQYGITHFPAVPPILQALTKKVKDGVGGVSLKSLKQVSCGAAPLYAKTIQDFVEAFPQVDFIQGYGMTESTAVGTRGFNTKDLRKYSSIGLLAPNTEAKVVDWVTGRFLPPGSSGELWIRGPGVMKGYLNNSKATALTIDRQGWLHTGDIVYIDSDGYLFIVDRLKEIIKYKGFQIAPADLEALLLSHPDVVDAAVTAVPDKECGEIPVAFVVRRQGSSVTESDIIEYVAKQVAPHKKVRKVIFVESIPKSAAGKILRRELRCSMASRL